MQGGLALQGVQLFVQPAEHWFKLDQHMQSPACPVILMIACCESMMLFHISDIQSSQVPIFCQGLWSGPYSAEVQALSAKRSSQGCVSSMMRKCLQCAQDIKTLLAADAESREARSLQQRFRKESAAFNQQQRKMFSNMFRPRPGSSTPPPAEVCPP